MASNRPKHSFTKEETAEAPVVVAEVNSSVEMNSKAYGIYKDKSGDWMVAQLAFDPVSGEAKVVDRLSTGHGDKTGAIDKFRIEVAKNIFG